MAAAPKRKPQPLKGTGSRASKRTKPSAAPASDPRARELHRASRFSFPLEALRQVLSHNISTGRPLDLLSLEHVVYDEYLRTPAAFKPRERFSAEDIAASLAASREARKSMPQEQMQPEVHEVQEHKSADETPQDELPDPELEHYTQLLLDIFTNTPEAPEAMQTEQTEAEQDLVSRCCSPTSTPGTALGTAPGQIPGLELITTNQSYQAQLEFIQEDQDGCEIPPSTEITEEIEEIEEIEVNKVNEEPKLQTYDWEYHDVALGCIWRYIEKERGKEQGQ